MTFDQWPILALNRIEWVVPPIPGRCLHQPRLEPIHANQLDFGLTRKAVPLVFAVVLAAIIGSGPQRPPVPPKDYRPPVPAQVVPPAGVPQLLHDDHSPAEGTLHGRLGRVIPAVPLLPLVGRPHDRRKVLLRRGHHHVFILHHHVLAAAGSPDLIGAGSAEDVRREQCVDSVPLRLVQRRRLAGELLGFLLARHASSPLTRNCRGR